MLYHLNELQSLQLYTADICSLYTNLSVNQCIEDVMEMATEFWEELETVGLTHEDIRNILTVGLSNSYFTFNGRLYRQLDGLFMGYNPSPILAVVRIHTFLKNSGHILYLQICKSILQDVYGRYNIIK